MSVGHLGSVDALRTDVALPARVPEPREAWIGFGSNLGDRSSNIARALDAFSDVLECVSPIYETAPWGVLDQPWFLNGVARLRWEEDAFSLLERCLVTERVLGRVRGERFGPRTIDLDVLVLGSSQLLEPGLTVPHPGIASRRSVLDPWADLCPDLVVPGLGIPLELLRERARNLPEQEVRLFSGTSRGELVNPALEFATSEQ